VGNHERNCSIAKSKINKHAYGEKEARAIISMPQQCTLLSSDANPFGQGRDMLVLAFSKIKRRRDGDRE